MPVAVAIVLTVLVLLVLALSFAVIRRLREHEARLAPAGETTIVGGPATGAEIPEVETATADGSPLATAALRGQRALIGFFATTCPACRTAAPHFSAEARRLAAAGTGRRGARRPRRQAGRRAPGHPR